MIRSSLFALMCVFPTNLSAQHAHQDGAMPTEVGQATFASISEIVEILNNDSGTDWSKVNIDALRSHLLDMDRVTMRAEIDVTTNAKQVVFEVTASGAAVGSIQRMITAHSPMLAAETGWDVQVAETSNGMTMTITVDQNHAFLRVNGLGFFGVMTIGAHHQEHHLMIATGSNPHH